MVVGLAVSAAGDRMGEGGDEGHQEVELLRLPGRTPF
jgi:hypothetical protein